MLEINLDGVFLRDAKAIVAMKERAAPVSMASIEGIIGGSLIWRLTAPARWRAFH